MEHGQLDGALDGKIEPTSLELLLKYAMDTRLGPEPGANQIRANAFDSDRFGLPAGMSINDSWALTKSEPGTKQGIELACGLKEIETAQGEEGLLADNGAIPETTGDLHLL